MGHSAAACVVPPQIEELRLIDARRTIMRAMRARRGSYTGYSIGVGITWAVILVLSRFLGSASRRDSLVLVFGGYALGWLSATIARYVYPPPKRRRSAPAP